MRFAAKKSMIPSRKPWGGAWLFLVLGLVACEQKPTVSPAKAAPAPERAGPLTARGAFAQAEKEAQTWNSGALPAEILSGEDIGESGASDYWEFHFVEPGMQKKFVVVVQAGRVKQAQEGRLAAPVPALPEDWMDSQPAFQKSVAAFFAHHPDPQSFQPGWLVCDSRNSPTPHWVMLFSEPQHLPVGSMIGAKSGDYLGEISR